MHCRLRGMTDEKAFLSAWLSDPQAFVSCLFLPMTPPLPLRRLPLLLRSAGWRLLIAALLGAALLLLWRWALQGGGA